jgi:predicted amino acid-binding ACT domain protein
MPGSRTEDRAAEAPGGSRSMDTVPTTGEVRELLAATSLPQALVDDLLAQASPVWLMGEPAEVLAGDLVLCHPPLAPDEVRAAVKPTDSAGAWRLSVVAHDRPGLLAAVAGALAGAGLSITGASASVWPERGLALQRVTAVRPAREAQVDEDWDLIGEQLRAAVGRHERLAPAFSPASPVTVVAQPQDTGRVLVTIDAPDRVGLLWAVASWFEDHDCNVEAYRAHSEQGRASDTFVVVGEVDCAGLAKAIGGVPVEALALPSQAARAAARVVLAGVGVAATVALRAWRVVRRSGSPEKP